ncbi:MAG: carboxypeptidase regulatory-like domain-containing protein [Planctomycetes bacterium]|nr:carboxypeptidase regulatory-like domain-containing protein [Planctomycetota bacterium]
MARQLVVAVLVLLLVGLGVAAWLGAGPSTVQSPGRTDVAGPASKQPEDAEPARQPALVVGRCVDAGGQGLSGCTVRIESPFDRLLRESTGGERVAGSVIATTAADGRFELRVPPVAELPEPAPRLELGIERDGHVDVRGEVADPTPGSRTDLGEIEIPRGVRLRARVTDPDGQPVAGATVEVEIPAPRVEGPSNWFWIARSGTTATDGRLVLDGDPWLPSGPARVSVGPAWELASQRRILLPGDRDPCELDLVLRPRAPGDRIDGVVLDRDGRPVARAVVFAVGTDGGPLPGGPGPELVVADGRFRLFRTATDEPVRLLVDDAPGCAPLRTEPIAWGHHGVELRLEPETVLELSVRGEDGTPIEDYAVASAWSVLPRRAPFRHPPRPDSDPSRVGGFGAGGVATVSVLPAGESWGPSRPTEVQLPTRPGVVSVAVVVPRLRPFDAEIVTPEGSPVAGSTVELVELDHRPLAPDRRLDELATLRRRAARTGRDPAAAFVWSSAVTDATGRARLSGPRVLGPLGLRVTGDHHQPLVREDLGLPVAGRSVRVKVLPAGRLVGRLRPVDALAAFRTTPQRVWPFPFPGLSIELRPAETGDSRARTREVRVAAADGSFASSGLAAGAWDLHLRWGRTLLGSSCAWESDPAPLARVVVGQGETTEVEVDVRPGLPAVLRCAVRLGGQPVGHAELRLVAVYPGGRATLVEPSSTLLDAEGRFVVGSLDTGRYLVLVRPFDGDEDVWLPATRFVDVRRGEERDETVEVAAVEVRLQCRDASGAPAAGRWLVAWHREQHRGWIRRLDDDGRATLRDVGAGHLELRAMDREPAARQWTLSPWDEGVELAGVDVELGAGPLQIERRLPAQ